MTTIKSKTELIIGENHSTYTLGQEAYNNCLNALKFAPKSKTNFNKLMEMICYYNMAVIKYKQKNLKESSEHFQKFFEVSKPFCRDFLEQSAYEKLLSENAFKEVKSELQISVYLQNSVKIFSEIYGENHSFVKDYISKIDASHSIFP